MRDADMVAYTLVDSLLEDQSSLLKNVSVVTEV
jgi:hypothetical protein